MGGEEDDGIFLIITFLIGVTFYRIIYYLDFFLLFTPNNALYFLTLDIIILVMVVNNEFFIYRKRQNAVRIDFI